MTTPFILPIGTQVVIQKEVYHTNNQIAHPAGAVGVIVRSPLDQSHSYRVRFSDGFEASVHHPQLISLSVYKLNNGVADTHSTLDDLRYRILYRCLIGSRAYGLEDERSDTDRRGIYLPTAEMQWSLFGVPEQLENDETQEAYWEMQKFLVLALKANPNVLECLYSPVVEFASPLAEELLAIRNVFLSKLVFQTYSGYVASQFKKMQTDLKNRGQVKWKHVMHLIRLLISGIDVLTECTVIVKVGEHRESLLAIKRGEMEFAEVDRWRRSLQVEFEQAFQRTKLPDRPDYQRANDFLIRARTLATKPELP